MVVGPGNNGADGLVAARHLSKAGYSVHIFQPDTNSSPLNAKLNKQCIQSDVKFFNDCPTDDDCARNYDLIVDAVFGFSFKPPVRPKYASSLDLLLSTKLPIASIDIPSGWNVEQGPIGDIFLEPELLISLTAPKLCARYFTGKNHYLGGRFIPENIEKEYELELIQYPGIETCVKIP